MLGFVEQWVVFAEACAGSGSGGRGYVLASEQRKVSGGGEVLDIPEDFVVTCGNAMTSMKIQRPRFVGLNRTGWGGRRRR